MSPDYNERTKEELLEEARRRDLTTSGTKQELIDRLEAHDKGSGAGGGRSDGNGGNARARPMDLARGASRQLAQLTGRKVEGVSGFDKADEGWRVMLDVVEVSKVPSSADVLASYQVMVDGEGELLAYERVARYVRGSVRQE